MTVTNRTDRNRLLNTLPNDLRDVIVKLNDGLDDAKREHDGGAVTDEQMETFWALLKYTTGLS